LTEAIISLSGDKYSEYLRDESRSTGEAESISFPRSEQDIINILAAVREKGIKLTVQGARTGITGGAVPRGGHIMNLSLMNKVTGARFDKEKNIACLTVQPGLLLSQLRKMLPGLNFDTTGWTSESLAALEDLRKTGPWFFTPDPTETTASLGGMAACNASGARSFYYGATRNHIESLRILLPDGSSFSLKRGRDKASCSNFKILTEQGGVIEGMIPRYRMPGVKNAAGYFVKDGMDLVDLFIGSEGTLGIITEIEIRLVPAPRAMWGVTVFFPEEKSAVLFVRAVRGEPVACLEKPFPHKPVAIEYFNHKSLQLLRTQKERYAAFGQIQELRPEYHTAIYVEYHANSDEELFEIMKRLGRLIAACGGNEENTWVAYKPSDMEKLHFFRHAVPESVNMLIDQRRKKDPALTKLGTDMAVPDAALDRIVDMYNQDLEEKGLDSVMFGHIGNNHIHVNILPHSMDDYLEGKVLYLKWAREAVRLGGTVSAEHGIGKLKTSFLLEMYGEEGVRQMAALKSLFDPMGILNSGNLFEV
jgi:D-lactate dehydrogenase (cytochrome)